MIKHPTQYSNRSFLVLLKLNIVVNSIITPSQLSLFIVSELYSASYDKINISQIGYIKIIRQFDEK